MKETGSFVHKQVLLVTNEKSDTSYDQNVKTDHFYKGHRKKKKVERMTFSVSQFSRSVILPYIKRTSDIVSYF